VARRRRRRGRHRCPLRRRAGPVDQRYLRPTEVDLLQGDPAKARARLGWRLRTTFAELVREMVEADLAQARRERRNASW
jgi:GDPmannose 4,6-dehydratase